MNSRKLTHRSYLEIMVPFILSTVTQPLLGAADLAVIGHMGNEGHMAGISIGTLIFNTIYWLFGFLRISTTGYSAQAVRIENNRNRSSIFFRPLFMAVVIASVLLLFQEPILEASLSLLSSSAEVEQAVSRYYYILIWGAPFVLANYVLLGWLMGQGNIKGSLTMQMTGNILNIILDLIFVMRLGFQVKGVAYATLISQITAFLIGIYYILPYGYFREIDIRAVLERKEMLKIANVNRNLMLRTVCLLVHNNLFTSAGSALGIGIISANAVLFQILSVISYLFDGIANTSSIFAGRAYGKRDIDLMKETWRKTLEWGAVMAAVLTLGYIFLYPEILKIFTNIPSVIETASKYALWIALYPALAFGGLTFYGIFTGTSITWPVFTSTFGALLGFLAVWKFIIPLAGNNGIWLGLLTFYFLRTVFLLPQLKRTTKEMEEMNGTYIGKLEV